MDWSGVMRMQPSIRIIGSGVALGACRTIEGYEAMHAIRKGQIRWVAKGDPVGQLQFIHSIFGVAA
jgi:transposase, IS6 family